MLFSICSYEQLWGSLLQPCLAAIAGKRKLLVLPTKHCSPAFRRQGDGISVLTCPQWCVGSMGDGHLAETSCTCFPSDPIWIQIQGQPHPKEPRASSIPLCLVASACGTRPSMVHIAVLPWEKQHVPPWTTELLKSQQLFIWGCYNSWSSITTFLRDRHTRVVPGSLFIPKIDLYFIFLGT